MMMLKATLCLMAIALLTSCGSSARPRDTGSASSSSTSGNGTTVTDASGAIGAQCNHFDAQGARLSGKVTTYYNNGIVQEDRIRLRITGIDAQFANSSNVYLQFYRWKASSTGATELDSTPLTFLIEKGTTASIAISGTMNAINNGNIQTFRQNGSVPGTSIQEFFDNTVFVITGVDYNWAALKVVLYDGTSAIGQADLLLPVFAANPTTYAQYHPPVLANLHPFNSQRSQSISDSEWLNRSKNYCF